MGDFKTGIQSSVYCTARRPAEMRETKTGRKQTTIKVAAYAGKQLDGRIIMVEIQAMAMDDLAVALAKVNEADRLILHGREGANHWTDKDGNARQTRTLWVESFDFGN